MTTITATAPESTTELTDMIAELSADLSVKGTVAMTRVSAQAVFLGQHEVIVTSTTESADHCEVVVTSALNVELRVDGEHVSGFESHQEAGHAALEFAEANLVGISLIAGLLDEIADRS